MLPKEHGAWMALVVCLAAGWLFLGELNLPALAATFFWIAGFLLRAPFAHYREYRKVDPVRAQKALVFFGFLLILSLASGLFYWSQVPLPTARGVLLAGIGIGSVLFLWSVLKRTLRHFLAEVLGFAGVCLAVPALVLTGTAASEGEALRLYGLFAGYFLTAALYVRERLEWKGAGRPLTAGEKAMGLAWTFALWALWAWFLGPQEAGDWAKGAAPLWAGARFFAAALFGRDDLPVMRLGLRESFHSVVFLLLARGTWAAG